MKHVISTEKKPIKLWLDDIEDGALAQAKNLANLPFVFKHIAIMPDSHQGYGMPIGGVMATRDVVVPNAVGVDIGCGMCAVKTSIVDLSQEKLLQIIGGSAEYKGGIKSNIPRGPSKLKKKCEEVLMPEAGRSCCNPIVSQEFDNARKQLGTLGGGNHFIEIQKGDDGHIWLMIHSGSRNLGYTVANHYNKIAKGVNKKSFSIVPEKWDLAFLPLDSREGIEYMIAMNYCVEFAKENRGQMMRKVLDCVAAAFGNFGSDPAIDVAHNYARLENHFGKNVMVHRKGATSARLDEVGIIPGSQGSPSYIVTGKGNQDSFESCSHGAGRLMSRTKAKSDLDLESELHKMGKVIHDMKDVCKLDEAPGSYKDIEVVMSNQSDLVDIAVKLRPLAVVKG